MAATPTLRVILCVLAGGRSRRFGSSKLRVRLNGEPILAWQARRLTGAANKVLRGRAVRWLSLAPHQRVPPGADHYERFVADPEPHRGPLAGMHAVVEAANRPDVVVFVPADMPLLEPEHLRRLAEALRDDDELAGVMARWRDGPEPGAVEPLPSIWRVGATRPLLERLLKKDGERAGPRALADLPEVGWIELRTARDALAWSSINRREDLDTVAAALGVRVEAEGALQDDVRQ